MKTRTVFQQPPNTMPKISELYAYVSVDDEDGNEGIVGAPYGGQSLMPLIAADRARMEQIMPLAQQVADHFKMKIKLVQFSNRQEIKTLVPNQSQS